MSKLGTLQKKISELEKLAEKIQAQGIQLFEGIEFDNPNEDLTYRHLSRPLYNTPQAKEHRELIRDYDKWYISAHTLVEEYLPSSLGDFVAQYRTTVSGTNGVIEYINLDFYTSIINKPLLINDFFNRFEKQISIVLCIPSVIEIQEMSLRQLLSADLARTEIEEAEVLLAEKHYRASGAIAGVALELHLKTMCDINGIQYPPKATLEPLAQALYKEGKLDITEIKHVQYLASIRNKCSHPNSVSETEVKTLVESVKKLV